MDTKLNKKIYCDDCGKEIFETNRHYCELCGKYLCKECGVDFHYVGDFDEIMCYCSDCKTISKEFEPEINELERKISILENKKIEKCMDTFEKRFALKGSIDKNLK